MQGETKPWLCFLTKTTVRERNRINSEREQWWENKTRKVSLKSTAERKRERESEGEMGWAVTALQQAAHNFSLLRLFNYTWECGNGEAGDAAVGMGLVQKSILVAITFLVLYRSSD